MAVELITQQQVSNRLGATRLARLTDDNRDGSADTDIVTQLRRDASSKVVGYLLPVMGSVTAIVAAAADDSAHEIVRVTLDVFEAFVARRHPEVMRNADWAEMLKAAERDLKNIREAYTRVDTDAAPNPPANVGGEVYPDPTSEPVYTFARDGFGDF
jgi:hypothetical protein